MSTAAEEADAIPCYGEFSLTSAKDQPVKNEKRAHFTIMFWHLADGTTLALY